MTLAPLIDHDPSVPLETWVASLPEDGRRPLMTADGYAALLRAWHSGIPVPYYSEPLDLLADLNLARINERTSLRRALETMTQRAQTTAPAVARVWTLVLAARPRRTLSVDAVRDALEGDA